MNTTSKKTKHLPGITVSHNIPDVSKDPYFIKKGARARSMIAKYGLPEDMLGKKSKKS
jgi:hypothetical protein